MWSADLIAPADKARKGSMNMNWTAWDFQPGEFTLKRRGPPPQTGKITLKKLTALIQAGYGQGHFQRYKPWLRVTKRDYSPNSNIGHLHNAELARGHHYRSRAERSTIQLARWLGAVDTREAFPVWPWTHSHPGDGLPGFDHAPPHHGLLKTARDAGIEHGLYPGTAIPYVATIDVMTTWHVEGHFRLIALENKPYEIAFGPDPLSRAKERLELTRRYCLEAGMGRLVLHGEMFPRELCVNLDMLEPTQTQHAQTQIRHSYAYRTLVDTMSADGYGTTPHELIQRLASPMSLRPNQLWPMFNLALWHQDIDHDLALPLKTWTPLIKGGRARKIALLRSWLGDGA
jgi:hypothetical protein